MGTRRFPMLGLLVLFLVLGLAGVAAPAQQEKILNFSSLIQVQTDGSLRVIENITVICAHVQIKRGIIREFPTRYKDRFGNTVRVGFEVLSIRRDNQPEPFHIRRVANGERIYIGRKEVILQPGTYTYTISYRTDRQLGFFKEYDELYWNVTGNGWTFAIDRAEAVVQLPPRAEIIRHAAYTGFYGAKGTDFVAGYDDQGQMTFATTRTLRPKEGLTIAVAWPKGIVKEPTLLDRIGFLCRDNKGMAVALISLAALLIYYLIVWYRMGRDPKKGTIIPRYQPPRKLSPAAMRIIYCMGYRGIGNKAFAAALVDMAVKDFLKIKKGTDDIYTLIKAGRNEKDLTRWEKRVAQRLFGRRDIIELKDKNHAEISGARQVMLLGLINDLENKFFFRNRSYFILGLGLTLVAGLVVYVLGITFVAGSILAILMVVNIVFLYLLKAPTIAGRKVMDEIEGFKLYLSVAEKDRLNLLNPPDRTPELFEKYLPYAIALDVENEWSRQFIDLLAVWDPDKHGYAPHWYSGDDFTTRLGENLGDSFSQAISSSSTAPGSSSGSFGGSGGGGGSSGGGGGGGGGSGW